MTKHVKNLDDAIEYARMICGQWYGKRNDVMAEARMALRNASRDDLEKAITIYYANTMKFWLVWNYKVSYDQFRRFVYKFIRVGGHRAVDAIAS